jgi:glycogen synthase
LARFLRAAGIEDTMRILLWSFSFYPNIGGLEAASHMLAEEFVGAGHEVTVITDTPANEPDNFSFKLVRSPRRRQLLRLVEECDVYLQNQISIRSAWPLLLVRRPWVVASHTWIPDSGIRFRIQHALTTFATCISCSREVASHLRVPSTVISEPYDNLVFRAIPGLPRDQDLIFVGRLVRAKGMFLLLEALTMLKARGVLPTLTIVGSGPESESVNQQVNELGLAEQVRLVGAKSPTEIAKLLNQHRILVVPSIWKEPFGIVALEGIACGCVVVGSEGGGLKDAIGPCGVTFPNGDASALENCLHRLLSEPDAWPRYREGSVPHLRPYTRSAVASSYLKVLSSRYDPACA